MTCVEHSAEYNGYRESWQMVHNIGWTALQWQNWSGATLETGKWILKIFIWLQKATKQKYLCA